MKKKKIRQVKIYRFRPHGATHGNFGDEITIDILWKIFGIEAVPTEMPEAELIGAGSILDIYYRRRWRIRLRHYLARHKVASDLHVWGTGFMTADSQMLWPQERIHIHAVRGPLTARRIGDQEIAIGDPGILASRLIDKRPSMSSNVALVPHYSDHAMVASKVELPKGWTLVDPSQPALTVISRIASSELVASSSLHGLIVADSLGIPCVWASTVTPLFGGTTYKFLDYEASRGRNFNSPASYGELIALKQEGVARLATTAGRNIADWQDTIIEAFPF